MGNWDQYARPVLVVFAAWAAVRFGFILLFEPLFFLFEYIPPFQWLSQIWILGAIGPSMIYFLFSGAVIYLFFSNNNWLRIAISIAIFEPTFNIYQQDFLSFVVNFQQGPEYSENFLFNTIAGQFVPLIAIPLGAFIAKWMAERHKQRAVSANHDPSAINLAEYRRAAAQGDSYVQRSLAARLATGDGCEKNEEEAREWYLRAAEQGNTDAMWNFGLMMVLGEGGVKDVLGGIEWIERAGEKRNPDAVSALIDLYKGEWQNTWAPDVAADTERVAYWTQIRDTIQF